MDRMRLLAALAILAVFLAATSSAQLNNGRGRTVRQHGRRRPHGPSFPVQPATPYVRVIPQYQQNFKPSVPYPEEPKQYQRPPISAGSFFQPKPSEQYTKPADDIVHYPEDPYEYGTLVNHDYACPRVYQDEAKCRPLKDCAVWFDLISNTYGSPCKLKNGNPGACCPDMPYNGHEGAFRTDRGKPDVKVRTELDTNALIWGSEAAQEATKLLGDREVAMISNNVTVRPSSSVFKHMRFFHSTNQATVNIGRGAYSVVEASRALAKRFQLSPEEAGFGLNAYSVRGTVLNTTCPAPPVCDPKTANSPYRTFDGSCNNLRRTSWGAAGSPQQRILPPNYSDGIWQPRVSVKSGKDLPSTRLVSITVVPDVDAPSYDNSVWLMQYGQFINHDIIMTPVFQMSGGQDIQCCQETGDYFNRTELQHQACLPISIPVDDPFYSKFNQRCMNFVRSLPAPRADCTFGHAEQMTRVSMFLDHSNVYGSSAEEARALRTLRGGSLIVTPLRGKSEQEDLLPGDTNTTDNCRLPRNLTGIDPPAHVQCFKAGDVRVNQLPDLQTAHTLFLRQHNLLVAGLAKVNPHWDDERLYLEARRIMTAQMQHITYNEYLPVILGREKMQEIGILPLDEGFSSDYDDKLNPSTVSEFSSAAFRFGHSTIQGRRDLVDQKRQTASTILLRNHFIKTQILYTPGNLDKFLIGLASQPQQNVDNYFTQEVTNHLFEETGRGFGLDLVSINIQRGRDHGMRSYNDYRSLCGLPKAQYFSDLLDVIPPSVVERFELLYESVDDIDLFIAGVSERPVPGAIVGPTFHCILSDKFLRLKRGDRYFYDLGGQAGSFSAAQLDEIRKTSFARIVCDNSNVKSYQPLAFKVPSEMNPVVDCSATAAIPRTNLAAWRDQQAKSL